MKHESNAVYVDWMLYFEDWEHYSRDVLKAEKEQFIEDSNYDADDYQSLDEIDDLFTEIEERTEPTMNYAWTVNRDVSHEQAYKIAMETNCVVMLRTNEDGDNEFYIALTGAGMDFSQDIAAAFHIIQGYVPFNLFMEMSKQPGLTIPEESLAVIVEDTIEEFHNYTEKMNMHIEWWTEGLDEIFKRRQR